MGFRISFIVAPALPRNLVAPLGFRLGVETDALPYDEWWVGSLKSNGQTVFWSEAADFAVDVADELSAVSTTGDVIACSVDEDAQKTSATCYHNGRVNWQIGVGATVDSLVATGDLPVDFAKIAENFAEQPLSIPTEVAATACGFNHETDLTNKAFTRFFRIIAATDAKVAPKAKSGFFGKLFGR